MAKARSRKSNSSKKPTRKVKAVPRMVLDPPAAAYARLIADPCNAPLTSPVYSGTEGGYVVRCDSFFTTTTGATETSGVILWTPGAIGSGGTEVAGFSATSASASGTVAAYGGTCTPGRDFLTSNASNIRCIAACLKLTYPGSESTRSGRVHFGQVSGSVLDVGDSTTVDHFAQTLPFYSRTPAETIEVVWKPNDADQLFTDPVALTPGSEKDRKAAIGIAVAGLPAGVGVTYHLTAVYEWQPHRNRGIPNPNLSKSMSNNTLDDVVNYLIRSGFQFASHAAGMMGHGLGQGIIGGISRTFGLMPSQAASRSSQRLLGS